MTERQDAEAARLRAIEERLALAKRISKAPGKSLSDIVIEDRGER